MANQLLNTPDARKLFTRTNIIAAFTDRTPLLNPDPWPLYVRYEKSTVTFVPRDQYYFNDPTGPSSCLWIVPGSAR